MSFLVPVTDAALALGVTKIVLDQVTCKHCGKKHRKGSKIAREHSGPIQVRR